MFLLRKNLINITVIILLLYLNGCDKQQINFDDIDIKIDTNYYIVIDGFLTNELSIQKVKLSKPIYKMDSIAFIPINNAKVFLTNEGSKYNYKLSNESGVFESEDSIAGKIGEEYTINVIYNNQLYTASDSMTECNDNIDFPIDDIRYFDDHIEINSKQHNFGYNTPSIWLFTESTDSLGNIVYFDINDMYNIPLYNHIGSLPQGLFPSGFRSTGSSGYVEDSLEIIKMSMSDVYYNYLISRFNITDWSGGIFSTTPGNTLTNVSEGGIGFFYVTEAKRFRLTYKDLADLYE